MTETETQWQSKRRAIENKWQGGKTGIWYNARQMEKT